MKHSAILISLTEPVQNIPAGELDAARRVLTQRIRGISEEHTRRWWRFLRRLFDGEVAEFYPANPRSLAYHRRHMAIEGAIWMQQDGFQPTKAGQRAFRNWIKTGASLVRLEIDGDAPRWLPGSFSFDELSDDEAREFHEAAMEFLASPHALRKLWPAVKAADRPAMLEAAINKDTEENP